MSKLFSALDYWCYGSSDTEAGQMARAITVISTTFIFGGVVSYFIGSTTADMGSNEMEYNKSSFSSFSYVTVMLLFFGALGYIIAPIIGHKLCCGSSHSTNNNQNITNINGGISTNQENYELYGTNVTPPPSYDEAMGLQQISVVVEIQNNYM